MLASSLLLVGSVALGEPAGGGGSGASQAGAAGPSAQGRSVTAARVSDSGGRALGRLVPVGAAGFEPPGARPEGALPPSTTVAFDVVLRPSGGRELRSFLRQLYTPGSPEYHRFLSRGQFARRFGPAGSTVEALRGGLESLGLDPARSLVDGFLLPVRARAGDLERALGVEEERYLMPSGRAAYANLGVPRLSSVLASKVLAVVGLSTTVHPQPLSLLPGRLGGSKPLLCVPQLPGLPSFYRLHPAVSSVGACAGRNRVLSARLAASRPYGLEAAGAPRAALASAGGARVVGAGHGLPAPKPSASAGSAGAPSACQAAQAFASGQGSYTFTQLAQAYGFDAGAYAQNHLGGGESIGLVAFAPYSASDISAFESCYGISTKVVPVQVGSGATSGLGNSVETTLDIEVAAGLAPRSTLLVYEAPITGAGPLQDFAAIADADAAKVVSTSYGICEAYLGSAAANAESLVFEQMAAQGQTMVAAAGDAGSEDCLGSAPSMAGAPDLSAVACPSSTSSCVAVGEDVNDGEGVVVSVESGVAGKVQAVAGTADLAGISCTSSSTCYAVGATASGYGVVVPVSGGEAGPREVVDSASYLDGISCVAGGSSCLAVGANSYGLGVLVGLSGGRPAYSQAVAGTSGLAGASCVGAGLCAAVGVDSSATDPEGAVVGLVDGSVTPVVDLASTSALDGVACPAAGTCVVVGSGSASANASSSGVVDSVVNGKAGSVESVQGATSLFGVSCTSSTSCFAVGAGAGAGVVVPVQDGAPGAASVASAASALGGVACDASACVGVGSGGQGGAVIEVDGAPGFGVGATGSAAPKDVSLYAMGCTSASSCIAVGSDSNGVGVVVPVLSGVPGAPVEVAGTYFLNDVSCWSSGCVAVGSGAPGSSGTLQGVVLEVSQSQMGQPSYVSSTVTLLAISCATSSTCYAVGPEGALTSTSSEVLPITNGLPGTPVAVSGVGLDAISCPSVSSCLAVGGSTALASSAEGEVVTVDSGEPGTPQAVSGTFLLDAVSCASASTCEAVGMEMSLGSGGGSTGSGYGVALQVSGGVPASAVEVAGTSTLMAVSCPASGACEAVGTSTGQTMAAGAIVQVSGGSPGSPAPVAGTSDLTSIACESATSCEALGASPLGDPMVLPVSDGAPGTPALAWFSPGLYGVSCYSASACVAVGSGGQSASASAVSSGSPGSSSTTSSAIALVAVSCPAAGACEAVGLNSSGEGVVATLSVTTSGASSSTPTLSSVTDVPGTILLDSVSCASAGSCVAVGVSSTGAEGVVVTIGSGTPSGPIGVSGTTGLNGVSCASSSVCEAVGFVATSGNGASGVVVSLSGGSPGSTATVSGATSLYGVDCASSTSCEAVGTYDTPPPSSTSSPASPPLAPSAQGVTVAISAGVPGSVEDVADASELLGISCTTAASCVAAGTDPSASMGVVVPLSSGMPGAAIATWVGMLAGISCEPGGGSCLVVGTLSDGQGLVETESAGSIPDQLTSFAMPAGLSVDDPASQPYVTAVGGTSLSSLGPPPVQSAWNDSYGAGGGGISSFWTMPSWQKGTGVVNQYTSGAPCGAPAGSYCRELPDVSASADPSTGDTIYYQGSWGAVGGTSAAAPMWAALFALADQACSTDVGFANPALYSHASDLQQVTTGNNDFTGTNGGLYPATPGYNMATGLGTPTSALFEAGTLCLAPSAEPAASGFTVVPSDNLTSAKASYDLSFTTSLKGALGPDSSISVTLAAGTILPSNPSDYAVSDSAGGSETVSSVKVQPAGSSTSANLAEVTLSASGITASDTVTLTIEGVTNPSLPSSAYEASLSTSSDTVTVSSAPYAILSPQPYAGTYVPISPARVVDTRCSENPLPSYLSASYCQSLPLANSSLSSPGGGGRIHVQVTGVDGIPTTGVAAVLVNLTFAGSFATGGYLSAYPTGTGAAPSGFSNLNWSSATYEGAVANLAVVEVGSGGEITIYNGSSSYTNVVVDIEGYYLSAPPAGSSATGSSGTGSSGTGSSATGSSGSSGQGGATYVPISPARVVDTRCSENPLPSYLSASYCQSLPLANSSLSSPGGGGRIHVQVTGVDGIPTTGVAAVLVNLTFAGSFATGGYLSAYPTGTGAAPSGFSNLNWSSATYEGAVANLAVVEVGSGGEITIYNGSSSYTNVVVDIEGYYLSAP